MSHRLLIIDDEPAITDSLGTYFQNKAFKTSVCHNVTDALSIVKKQRFDAILCDYKLPDGTGVDFLQSIRENNITTPTIIITAYADIEKAVEAIKEGAFHFVSKPFQPDALNNLVNKAVELSSLKNRALEHAAEGITWGNSRQMQELKHLAEKVSESDSTCLIIGETGSGKEMVARYIHKLSNRKDKPFIAVNCAALTETLLESELFGHEKGAFTGADKAREGRFELADGGTILLDEITETSQAFQGKLLRVLQEKQFERVGSSSSIKTDIRIIATTNKDIEEEVKKGRFREDLFFRLNVIPVKIPPLREHIEDIPELVSAFSKQFASYNTTVTEDAIRTLSSYSWPGNIRELKNIVERAITLSSGKIHSILIEPWLNSSKLSKYQTESVYEKLVGVTLKEIEEKLINQTLKRVNGNKDKAAQLLGITTRTLYNKLKEYQGSHES